MYINVQAKPLKSAASPIQVHPVIRKDMHVNQLRKITPTRESVCGIF
jgi:hypothetical protein